MPHKIALLGCGPFFFFFATGRSIVGGQREAWGKGRPFFRREMYVGQAWPFVPKKEPSLGKTGGGPSGLVPQCHTDRYICMKITHDDFILFLF